MSLLSLQRDMRAWLVCEDEAAAGRLGDTTSPGLGVYQNNYRAQLVGCLENSFEHTRLWIGHEEFLRAAAHHIDRVPPSSWTLDAYAHDFPATLAWLYPTDAEVAEIARIELALEEAFVVIDQRPVAVEQLGEIAWDDAVMRLLSSIELIGLTTNALAIWSAVTEGAQPPPAEHLAIPEVALVWRQDGRCRIRVMDELETSALLAIRTGARFGALCADLARMLGDEQSVLLAGQWLGRWLADGLIVAVEDGTPSGSAT